MDAELRAITPTPNEIIAGSPIVALETERPVGERAAESGVRVFDRREALVRGSVKVLDGGRKIEWRPSQPLATGAYRVSVEELATPDGERIEGRLDVPFAVVDETLRLPDGIAVRALRTVAPATGDVDLEPAQGRARGRAITLVKGVDRRTGEPTEVALDREGKKIDAEKLRRDAAEAHAKKFGKVTPALARRMSARGTTEREGGTSTERNDERIPVAIWLAAPDDEADADKAAYLERGRDPERGQGPRAAERSERTAEFVARFTESTERILADARVRADRLAPVVYGELTRRQIQTLARRDEVAAIFPHDTRGFDDLNNSIAIAEAAAPQNAGVTGRGIRVAVFEQGPDNTTNLDIEAFYDPGQSSTSSHARMTHGIIKNTSTSGSNGFAPDCDLYSANSYDNDALAWAVGQACTVISQSFHRDAEQTDSGLSFDDIYKDWLALRSPYPTIIQASGNGPDDEYVSHKGFNSISVGNHDDTATAMSGSTIFRNPASAHADRELPEIAANGTGVTVVGLTDSGTSFAAPAVAGTAALVQSADTVLRSWPEGTRAILLAGARRNVSDGAWWPDVSAGVDGSDGSGALNARASVDIARNRGSRDAGGTQRGYDIGRFEASDFDGERFLRWSYNLTAPRRPFGLFTTWKAKAVFTWNGKIDKLRILGFEFDYPIGSHLAADIDLEIYDSRGNLVAGSWSWDNSYEIAEWNAIPGETYRIRPRKWSGTDASWFGVAWTAIPVFRPVFELDEITIRTVAEGVAAGGGG
ncbi:MAG TPA: S8 family serine peptidase [Candidatus Limnocylindrales bacterium]|nr:S8 family serine peptidase [Candidatus Limnocylindrales bacterium]